MARNLRAGNTHRFGAVMIDHPRQGGGQPYSPLISILFLLTVGAATQLGVYGGWF
jgi:hypothetical protein